MEIRSASLSKLTSLKVFYLNLQNCAKSYVITLVVLRAGQLVIKIVHLLHYTAGSIGFAVIETTDDDVIMGRRDELLMALAEDKVQKGFDCLYLAVVNIVELRSQLLMISPNEISLAQLSFKGPGYVHPTGEFLCINSSRCLVRWLIHNCLLFHKICLFRRCTPQCTGPR